MHFIFYYKPQSYWQYHNFYFFQIILQVTSIVNSYLWLVEFCVTILKTIYSQIGCTLPDAANVPCKQFSNETTPLRDIFVFDASACFMFVLCYSVILAHDKADLIYILCCYYRVGMSTFISNQALLIIQRRAGAALLLGVKCAVFRR